jgi:hypothetical protein
MKLKDHPKFPPKQYWVLGRTERQKGQNRLIDYPNMSQAVILNVEKLRQHQLGAPSSLDQRSVVIHAENSEDVTEMTGTTILLSVPDKMLATNLLQTAQKFLGKTVEELRDSDVTDEMLLTS